MVESRQIDLWRDVPPASLLSGNESGFPEAYIFPSGRQALSRALLQLGLSRSKRVACPEWSSHCLLSAVARHATPVPMREVVQKKLTVDAILLYDQWGWSAPKTSWERLSEMFPSTLLIWDRVDSADFFCRTDLPLPSIAAEVSSLSKVLGLSGGGLLRCGKRYIEYQSDPLSQLTQQILRSGNELLDTFEYKEYLKNHKQVLHPDLLRWVRHNSLSTVLQDEGAIRRRNLCKLMESGCAQGWEPWMKVSVEEGSTAANIAPLFRAKNLQEMGRAIKHLREQHGLTATNYHFNWSGDPLFPKYEMCLALPVHGLVTNFEDIVADLAPIC